MCHSKWCFVPNFNLFFPEYLKDLSQGADGILLYRSMEAIADCNEMQEDGTSIEQWMTVYEKMCVAHAEGHINSPLTRDTYQGRTLLLSNVSLLLASGYS